VSGSPAHPTPLLILALGCLSALGPLSLDLNLPALPEIASDLDASQALGQITMSACLVGLALGQLIVGPLSDRRGRRLPLLVGMAAYAGLSMLCAVAPSISALIVLRTAQGFAGAVGIVLARAIVRDLFDGPEVARTLSLLMLVSGTAPLVAPILGGQLLKIFDWRGLFVVLAALALFIALLATTVIPESLPKEARHAGGLHAAASGFGRVFSDPLFSSATLLLTLSGAASFTYISVSSFVLQTGFSLTPEQFSFVFAGNSAGVVALGYLNAILVRRFPVRTLLVIAITVSFAGALGCVVGSATSRELWALLIPLFVTIAGAAVAAPNATALALSRQKRDAGTASAIIGMGPFLAGAALSPIALLAGASALAMSTLMAALLLLAWIAGHFVDAIARRTPPAQ
jgi:DHA1 family bicyclomycin/chloramphenicol resistance-like MFS transporter